MDLRLRELSAAARLGLSALLLVLVGGFVASGQHLVMHHEKRDEQPGLTSTDLLGAYHGVETTAPMVTALERGHPEDLRPSERELLLEWLRGDRISDDYDNLDLGDAAPAELISMRCLGCHTRASTDEAAKAIPLEYWDDVEAVSFSRSIAPTDVAILVASTHTHALALGTLSLVLALLLLATRWPAALTHGLVGLSGLALLADLAGWWLVRSTPELLWVLIGAGAVYALTSVAAILLVLAELWLPRSRA